MSDGSSVSEDPIGLIERACGGDEQAWQGLWRWVEPRLEVLLAQPRILGRLARQEDERRAVILLVMEKLRTANFRRLKLFLEGRATNPEVSFVAWLTVVARRVGVDHVRAHPDYIARRNRNGSDEAGTWVAAQALPSETRLPARRPPFTEWGTAGQLLAYARQELPLGHQQALMLWIQGQGASEIASALGLAGPAVAEKKVRAALERLRRKFRTSTGKAA